MRRARILILGCLLVAFAVLILGATRHVRAIRTSLRQSEERLLKSSLKVKGQRLMRNLRRRLSDAPVTATYDLSGRLLRPAPPAEARPWEPPYGTLSALFLRRGELDRALAAASDSIDRAMVRIARGTREKRPDDLRAALQEKALRGTDLWYRARLELFRLEGTAPDADWIDDVSALIGGPSDGIGQTLLKQAGVEPVRSRRERAQLAALEPSVGLGLQAESFQEVRHGEANELVLKRIPIREFGWVLPRGSGPVKWRDESRLNFTSTFDRRTGLISEPLPAPLGELSITAELDEEKLAGEVRRETWLVVLLYACAGLLVALATGVSLVATRRALRLARDQSDFVANVTHELKTPLANVHLYAESLRQGRVREEDREAFLDTILEETRRLDGLVEGLLHAARGAKITRARVDTRELVKQAAARWRPRLEEEGFEFEVAPGPSVEISADAEALLRALDNLLDNARKYSREDRRIHLSGSCNDGLARLTVRDHGPGIPVQDRKRVLEPFTRLERADRKETRGTGLGLSLAAACMKAHGGRVEISENSGAGSVVSLVLVLEGVR